MGQVLDALLGAIGLVDVDARVRVSDGFGILGHGASVYDVREPDTQEKNLEIVARWRRHSRTSVPRVRLCDLGVSLASFAVKIFEPLTAKFAKGVAKVAKKKQSGVHFWEQSSNYFT